MRTQVVLFKHGAASSGLSVPCPNGVHDIFFVREFESVRL